ncbi:MAG: glucose-6-phosphate isomerase, partial [Candidatus Delongbacteria bacterium]
MLKKINPTHTAAWEKLMRHYKKIREVHLRTLFEDKDRFKKFSIKFEDILLDHSKNRIDETTVKLLTELAD